MVSFDPLSGSLTAHLSLRRFGDLMALLPAGPVAAPRIAWSSHFNSVVQDDAYFIHLKSYLSIFLLFSSLPSTSSLTYLPTYLLTCLLNYLLTYLLTSFCFGLLFIMLLGLKGKQSHPDLAACASSVTVTARRHRSARPPLAEKRHMLSMLLSTISDPNTD